MLSLSIKTVLLTILPTLILANSQYTISLEEYRLNGLNTLENKMDIELTKQEYWSKYLKDKNTKFGYIEEYSSILTCNKKKSTLTLYMKNSDQEYEFKRVHSAFTGENKGDKIKEGDKKTPIGIYKITEKLSHETKLDPFYGPLAFVTSYPNTYDTYLGKNGHGIWIHGLPTKRTREQFTRGCIAIKNSNIECLDSNIKIEKTLLIINNKKVQTDISKDLLASILSELYLWRYSWLHNNIDNYLNFYSSDFIRSDGMDFNSFTKYKTRVFKKIEKKIIIFKNINIIPYPNTQNIYQITFEEFYKSKSYEFVGNKTLMVRINTNKKMKIFTEK